MTKLEYYKGCRERWSQYVEASKKITDEKLAEDKERIKIAAIKERIES